MRVLVISQYYLPENVLIVPDVAAELSRRGHTVRVLTGYPNYRRAIVYGPLTELAAPYGELSFIWHIRSHRSRFWPQGRCDLCVCDADDTGAWTMAVAYDRWGTVRTARAGSLARFSRRFFDFWGWKKDLDHRTPVERLDHARL